MHTAEYIQITSLGPELGRLQLSGELTVKNAQEIKENVLKALQSFKQLEILIAQPEAIDITLFQMMESARLSAHQHKKKLTLTYQLPEELQALWVKAGLTLENQ